MPRRLVVLIAALSTLLAMPSTALAGTRDQAQENGPNPMFTNDVDAWAQVFTAGLTGQLDQVDLLLADFNNGGPGTDLTVELWTVTSGAPANLIPGATTTVPDAGMPDFPAAAWVSIPFNVPVVAGTQYAIAVRSPGSDADCLIGCWVWWADDTGPYAGGLSFLSTNGGATYAVAQARDQAFRTFVAVPAPTPAASLADAATAAPNPASPLATLGFALLLIGSLGTLAFVNVRRR
jgi:hypothetical protein